MFRVVVELFTKERATAQRIVPRSLQLSQPAHSMPNLRNLMDDDRMGLVAKLAIGAKP